MLKGSFPLLVCQPGCGLGGRVAGEANPFPDMSVGQAHLEFLPGFHALYTVHKPIAVARGVYFDSEADGLSGAVAQGQCLTVVMAQQIGVGRQPSSRSSPFPLSRGRPKPPDTTPDAPYSSPRVSGQAPSPPRGGGWWKGVIVVLSYFLELEFVCFTLQIYNYHFRTKRTWRFFYAQMCPD